MPSGSTTEISDIQQNPFQQSRVVQLAKMLADQKTHTDKPATLSKTETAPKAQQFEMSTKQIIDLINRFHLKNLQYAELDNLSKSLMSPKEREFIDFLRRNPHVFDRIAGLDQDMDGISIKDIKIASSLAGDTLKLSDQDIQYLQKNPLAPPNNNRTLTGKVVKQAEGTAMNRTKASEPNQSSPLTQTDLKSLLTELSPSGKMTYETLMSINPDETGLTGKDLKSLRFLQSDPVSKVLLRLVATNHHVVSTDIIGILASLLWNPSIYGTAPMLFVKSRKEDPLSIREVEGLEILDDEDHRKGGNTRKFAPTERIIAHHVLDICHRLNPVDGHITLSQLRSYQPLNKEEAHALKLLQQSHVFKALASLDHDEHSLSDDDIRLALDEGVIVLYDPHLILVVQP
jgi:hypothetical protein